MILTCENCHTRYLVPPGAIGVEGREVRCASCQYQWFQEPEDITVYPQQEELEPIPQSVRPVPEGSALPVIQTGGAGKGLSRRQSGYMAAAVVAVLILGGLVVQRTKVVHAWLPSVRLYEALHMAPVLPGEGLVFNHLTAAVAPDAQGINVLKISGTIINASTHAVKIPPLQASIALEGGKAFDIWRIDPPQPDIAPNGKVDFTASYPAVPDKAKEVKINLLLQH